MVAAAAAAETEAKGRIYRADVASGGVRSGAAGGAIGGWDRYSWQPRRGGRSVAATDSMLSKRLAPHPRGTGFLAREFETGCGGFQTVLHG